MRTSWLMCVLMGTLAWGQAAQTAPPMQSSPAPTGAAQAPAGANPPAPMQAPNPAIPAEAPKPAPAKEVPPTAVVLTIKGVCPAAPKAANGEKGAATKTAAPAKKSADCETKITRAEFDKLAAALQQGPNPLNPQQKRQLATLLPRFMAMSDAAKTKGLDKTPKFQEKMKFYRMQVLTQELQANVQEQADKIPQSEIEAYYKAHPENYEQFSLDRLFIPRLKQVSVDDEVKDSDQKLTDEQQKAKEAADKAKQEQGEQELTKLADTLRERAASGEDFAKLQKEAFEAAGQKVENPTVNLPKVRRTGLPAAHASVFDLKAGEVSTVISDTGGHYIYKVVSKEVLPLDATVQTEIHNKLKNDKVKEVMDKYSNSFQATTNDDYFGPPTPSGPMMPPRRGMMRPNMPQATPNATPAPAPAAQPPSKPN